MITPEALVQAFDIQRDDSILFASNMERLLWKTFHAGNTFDFNDMIDRLQMKIGAGGNLLFPTYNWDFCRGVRWEYHKTKSKTGTLSGIALQRTDFCRTKHALYSFAVWGKERERLYRMKDGNSFVGDTPFNFLYVQPRAKMIMFDVDMTHSCTFVHFVEETMGVPYRYLKYFTGQYVDEKGLESTRTFSMYVRDLERKVIPNFTGLENILLEKKKMKKSVFEDCVIWEVSFQALFEEIADIIRRKEFASLVELGKR